MAMQRKLSKAAIERLGEMGRDLDVLLVRALSPEECAQLPPMEGWRDRMREPLDDWRVELAEIQERYLNQAESPAEQAAIILTCESRELAIEEQEVDTDFDGMIEYLAEARTRAINFASHLTALLSTLRQASDVGDEKAKKRLFALAELFEIYHGSLLSDLSDTLDEIDPTRKKRKK